MAFFNQKWQNSSVLTKAAVCMMLLHTLLLLIGTIILMSWEVDLFVILLVTTLISALLLFGLFKVAGAARVFTILWGLLSLIGVILGIMAYQYIAAAFAEATGEAGAAVAQASGMLAGIVKSIVPALLAAIPPGVLATIGFFVFIYCFPPVLLVLTMVVLFLCGKDFKKITKDAPAKA